VDRRDDRRGLEARHVFIDTSAYLPRYYPPQLLHFLETYGRHKVLFGTNWPQLRWDVCMEQVGGLGLSEGAKEAFLHTNAARVFGLS
jgi:predicted TIM-barrel fold metal-dependent hydrolase